MQKAQGWILTLQNQKQIIWVRSLSLFMDIYLPKTVFKYYEISWRCSSNKKKCKAKLRTDIDVSKVTAGNMEHNHESDSRQIDMKVLSVRVNKKAHENVLTRPSKIISSELVDMDEENLRPTDKTIVLFSNTELAKLELLMQQTQKLKDKGNLLHDLTLLRAFHSSFVPKVILFRKGQFDIEESVLM